MTKLDRVLFRREISRLNNISPQELMQLKHATPATAATVAQLKQLQFKYNRIGG